MEDLKSFQEIKVAIDKFNDKYENHKTKKFKIEKEVFNKFLEDLEENAIREDFESFSANICSLLNNYQVVSNPDYAKDVLVNNSIAILCRVFVFDPEIEDQSEQTNVSRALLLLYSWSKFSPRIAFEIFRSDFIKIFEENRRFFKVENIIFALNVMQIVFKPENIRPVLSIPFAQNFIFALNSSLSIFNECESEDSYLVEDVYSPDEIEEQCIKTAANIINVAPEIEGVNELANFLYNVYQNNESEGVRVNSLRALVFLVNSNEIRDKEIIKSLCSVALMSMNEVDVSFSFFGFILSEKLIKILSEERNKAFEEHKANPQMSDEDFRRKESEDDLAQFFSSFPYKIVCKAIEDSSQQLNIPAINLAIAIVKYWDMSKLLDNGVIKSLIFAREMSFSLQDAAFRALALILQNSPGTIYAMIEEDLTPDIFIDSLQSSSTPGEILKGMISVCLKCPEIGEKILENELLDDISSIDSFDSEVEELSQQLMDIIIPSESD